MCGCASVCVWQTNLMSCHLFEHAYYTHTRTRTRTSICVSQINEHRPLSFSTIEWITQHFMIVYEREADKEEEEEGGKRKVP